MLKENKGILLLAFFLVGTIIMIVVMNKTGATLKTQSTPHGILDLEFAYNTDKTTRILNAWSPVNGTDNITAAKNNTWFDFLFLFFYAGFLSLACKGLAKLLKGPVAKAGNIIAAGALLAGFFDVLENIGMLMALSGSVTAGVSFLTTFFSFIKWTLAAIAVLYILTGLLALAIKKARR